MKLSFSLSSSSSSSKPSSSRPLPAANNLLLREEEEKAAASAKSEFVTVFDPTVTLTADAAPAASIAPLPNTDTWRAPKRMKNLLPPPSDPESSSSAASEVATRFELDTSQPDTAGGSYGLTLRSKGGGDGDGDAIGNPDGEAPSGRSEPGISAEQKFRDDIERLPEDRGMDEFQDISVEDFSRALLVGYGWKAGQGIGRNAKEDTKVKEYKKWAGNGGLGFKPDMAVDKGWKKRREELPPVPPPTGSARTSANGSSAATEKANEVVRVIAGEHAGSRAEVLERSSRSSHAPGKVVLRLLSSGLEVKVRADMIAEFGSAEEERCLRKLEVREGGERKDEKQRDDTKDGGRKHKNRNGRSEDGRSSSRDGKRESSERHNFSSDREGEPVSWLRSHIRVRIISKDFRGGRLYLKKGEVTDVVGRMTCDLSIDESGELLQGVDQEILETALPRRGGPVLVLFGRYKGRFGNLMEKDTEEETAVIRDADNHELIKVRLEQIAEYVGDPCVLGY